MDDLEVIRFLAMDIITNLAYHAFPQKKRPFFVIRLLIGVPTFRLWPNRFVSGS